MELSATGCCCIGRWYGFLFRLTCHMPGVFGLVPSNTARPYFNTSRLVTLKVAIHPSSYSCPIDTRDPDCRWGKVCYFLDVGVRRGLGSAMPYGLLSWGCGWVLLLGGRLLSVTCFCMGCLPLYSSGFHLCWIRNIFLDWLVGSRYRLVPDQDGHFFYTRSHLNVLQNCALLFSTKFQFIFIFKKCITQYSHWIVSCTVFFSKYLHSYLLNSRTVL